MMEHKFEVGDLVTFTKSGSRCRVVGLPDRCGGYRGLYTVARVDTGKEMMVPEAGLVLVQDDPADP